MDDWEKFFHDTIESFLLWSTPLTLLVWLMKSIGVVSPFPVIVLSFHWLLS